MPVRWSTLVLGILVLAAGVWAGPFGIFCAAYALALIASLLLAVRNGVRGAWKYFLILLGVGLGLFFLLPSISRAGPSAWRVQCAYNNMKHIALALDSYREKWRRLPPPYLPDAAGRTAHSWRVLILPYTELESLYNRYHFEERWDGPRNSELLKERPTRFLCYGKHQGYDVGDPATDYFAVVGRKTAWDEEGRSKPLEGSRAGPKRVLVVEVADSNVPWTAPVDMSLDEALRGINPKSGGGVSSRHDAPYPGVNVAFTDGSVEFLPSELPLDLWRALLTGEGDGTESRLQSFLRRHAEQRARAERLPWLVLGALSVAFLAHGLVFGVLRPGYERSSKCSESA